MVQIRLVKKKHDNYNRINFDYLFQTHDEVREEKLRTLLHYFDRITEKMPNGIVSFERCVQPGMGNETQWPDFDSAQDKIQEVHILGTGIIEREGEKYVQADFANKFIGGGVLGFGCVQEEIRFLICPEFIVSMLFTEVMQDNECVVITGAEMFSKYTGYSDTYKFDKNHVDRTNRDCLKRRMTQLVAMDAIPYYDDKRKQYQARKINRDIQKAFISFNSTNTKATIATGNWGCGAFGGDPELKV